MYRVKNAFKIALVVIFLPFLAFLLLVVGIGAKDKRVTLEGALYATIFILAVTSFGTMGAFFGFGAMALSGGRAFWRRDLWLDGPKKPAYSARPAQGPRVERQPAPAELPRPDVPVSASISTVAASVSWASAHAKAHKHRLPTDSYVSILELCHTLDSVVDAERIRPSRDARFEFELEALATDYLPTVLKSYLAIPADMVDIRQPNGKTPNKELTEQLSLLQGQAETLRSARHGASSAQLTSSGNFLRERFGPKQGQFDFGIE